ncbi:hypothetical protein EXIGLDRAFT_694049 [Exidia glandulosa HHB12029]|uniref:Uncharacterized protein n=1 Tax=Exidia glandulosa HHB12029 TaxID=1314781 RepID=A0A165GUW5_EXIGL|nr:hypothetical protein EXIGLDRAFT_694049 [Exidia glandulosa HHB12029]
MVAPIALEQFFPTPLPSPAPGMGIDPHAPTFVGSVSKLLKTSLDARRRSDDTLLARVRGETVRGMEVYRLHLVEDEIRYRRDEETVVLGGIAKLLTRLMEKEKIDMAGLDNEAAAKRTQENDELERLAREKAIVADMERRAKAADREAERVRKDIRKMGVCSDCSPSLADLGGAPPSSSSCPTV